MDVGIPSIKDGKRVCDVCEVSKHTRSSFPAKGNSDKDTLQPLEVVHADIFGPVETLSVGGAKYGLIFTDGYSRWRSFFAMANRSETLSKFKQYLEDMSGMLKGAKVVRLHSDGGGEFMSEEFKSFCKSKGIHQTNSSPRTPEQNGLAERSNRTVLDMARSMRVDAGLDKEMWAMACDTAVYLINRLPSAVIGGATPYQRLFNKSARLEHVRIFGCRAYVQFYNNERKKLDEKAWRGILVGYHPFNYRCYRVYDPKRRKTYMSTHVTFDEESFPGRKDAALPIPAPKAIKLAKEVQSDPVVDEPEKISVGERTTSFGHDPIVTRRREVTEVMRSMTTDSDDSNTTTTIVGGSKDSVGDKVKDLVGKGNEPTKSNEGGNLTWSNPWCRDPGCNDKSIHMAHLGVHYAYTTAEDILGDPRSFKEAMQSAEASQWHQAAIDEYRSLIENGTWTLVPKPKGNVNIVGSKWVFKSKRDEHGEVVRYKARLVAQGYSQEYGTDYNETFSPVVRFTSIRTILAIAARDDFEIENMDVETAFLNAYLDETIYLRQPQGFQERGPNGEELVCKLEKAIYGLKQASRNWNLTINEWLTKEYGMERSLADTCVYIKNEEENQKLIVTIWVDDLIIVGSNMSIVNKFKIAISRRFNMKDIGELKWILGIEIKRDRANRTIKLSQSTYISQMLQNFGMFDCKPIGTPIEGNLRRLRGGKPDTNYMSIVGSLLYASMVSRPDITYSVQALSRHFQSTGPEHLVAAKRVLKYLKGTIDKGIIYRGHKDPDHSTSLIGYSDSDWGSDIDTRRSTTGYIFTLNSGAISWGSKLQPTVALSSAEAEYMAVSSAVQEGVHLRQLLGDLGYRLDEPTTIYEDNMGCIALSNNPVFHKRTKHIDIRYHFVRERVESGVIEIRYLPTNQQLADIFTKPLCKQRIILLSNAIMEGVSIA